MSGSYIRCLGIATKCAVRPFASSHPLVGDSSSCLALLCRAHWHSAFVHSCLVQIPDNDALTLPHPLFHKAPSQSTPPFWKKSITCRTVLGFIESDQAWHRFSSPLHCSACFAPAAMPLSFPSSSVDNEG
eukprot:GGOE01012560.1.p2 GENE.GGOE01012560.1~~GGOE01012560.1.p2  ORF type:complete len:130 (+),score=2.93 GGOE01012560.1:53-442(+)